MNILREKFEIACLNDNYGLTVEPPVPTKAIDFILYTPDKGLLPVAYDVYYDAYYQSDHFPSCSIICYSRLKKKNVMKTIEYYSKLILICISLLVPLCFAGCEEDIEEPQDEIENPADKDGDDES